MRISLAIFLLLISLVGCASPDRESTTVVIRNESDFNARMQELQDLTKEPLIRYVTGEPMTGDDQARLEEAQPLIAGMIEFDPTDYRLPFVLGQTQKALGNISRAETAFKQARVLTPDEPETEPERFLVAEIENEMASISYAKQRYAEAIDRLTEAERLYPHSAKYPLNIAQIYIDMGDVARAKDALDRANALDPDSELELRLRKLIRLAEEDAGAPSGQPSSEDDPPAA